MNRRKSQTQLLARPAPPALNESRFVAMPPIGTEMSPFVELAAAAPLTRLLTVVRASSAESASAAAAVASQGAGVPGALS